MVGSGGGETIVPISTVAAEEAEGAESVSDGGAVTSASDSDGVESGDESDSGDDEKKTTTTTSTAAPPATATPPPAIAPPGAPAVIQPPPAITTTSTTPPPPPPAATTSTKTSAVLPPPALAPVQTETPPATTSTSSSSRTFSTSRTNGIAMPIMTGATTSTGVQTLIPPAQTTSAGTTSVTQDTAAEISGSPAKPSTGVALLPTVGTPAADVSPPPPGAQPETEGLNNPDNALGAVAPDQGGMNAGAAAGIVIGVLAIVGLLLVGGFFWKKWRDNGKRLSALPLFLNRSEKSSGPDMAYGGAIMEKDTAPILPPTMAIDKKTNSEMMDALMQATYKAEGGYSRDSAPRAPGQGGAVGVATFGEKGGPGFMNETTYTALAGPPTPAVGANGAGKPLYQWLDGVKTPRQSGAPPIRSGTDWPVSEYASGPPPAQPTPALPKATAPWQQDQVPVGRPPMPDFLPPQPAFQRDPRYTTTTTTSSQSSDVRWG